MYTVSSAQPWSAPSPSGVCTGTAPVPSSSGSSAGWIGSFGWYSSSWWTLVFKFQLGSLASDAAPNSAKPPRDAPSSASAADAKSTPPTSAVVRPVLVRFGGWGGASAEPYIVRSTVRWAACRLL